MNEVMCLAEDLGVHIYYQDTDSMHISRDSVNISSVAFRAKYNRDLIDNQPGKFHSDFSGINQDRSEKYVVESYFIDKKAYIDRLSNDRYHIHLKEF